MQNHIPLKKPNPSISFRLDSDLLSVFNFWAFELIRRFHSAFDSGSNTITNPKMFKSQSTPSNTLNINVKSFAISDGMYYYRKHLHPSGNVIDSLSNPEITPFYH